METILQICAVYWMLWHTWWWIPLVCTTYVTIIAYFLMGKDQSLSILKAVQLAFAGTLCIVPYMSKYIPILSVEFTFRWNAYRKDNFKIFAPVLLVLTILFVPIMAVLVYFMITIDRYVIAEAKKKI